MTAGRSIGIAIAFAASVASAQPVTTPAPATPTPTPTPGPTPTTPPAATPAPEVPLAQLRDEKQLTEALAAITGDPSIKVDDPKARSLAQALMNEGVHQLKNHGYDQALANFLEAYDKFPSPKILLDIASTLRDMGRLADAANTYQRYLSDPATGAERVAEVKGLLIKLDEQLTILTLRVFPRGSDLSIDGGPYAAVGSSLLTRVRPGIHLVRVRRGTAVTEVNVNGFEGENKEVSAALKVEVGEDLVARDGEGLPPAGSAADGRRGSIDVKPSTTPGVTPVGTPTPPAPPPEHVEGWLITGTQYAAADATGRERKVRAGYAGAEVAAIVPAFETSDTGEVIVHRGEDIGSGLFAIARASVWKDKSYCCAGGLGFAYAANDRFELDVAVLRSGTWGGFLGARYRLLTGWLRPYAAAGMPIFFYSAANTKTPPTTSNYVSPGLRLGGGVELRINGHFSVEGDLGYEHFFNVHGTFEPNQIVPTVGVIGRL